MEKVYIFRARDGRGTVATSKEDGSNLPNGPDGWLLCGTHEARKMTADIGVVGVGNAAEILKAVRATGLFISLPPSDVAP